MEERRHPRRTELADLDDARVLAHSFNDDDDANRAGQEPVRGACGDSAKGDPKLERRHSAASAHPDNGRTNAAGSAHDVEDISDRNARDEEAIRVEATRLTNEFAAADAGTGSKGDVRATDGNLRRIDADEAFALGHRGGEERQDVSACVRRSNNDDAVAAVDGAREHVRDGGVENTSLDQCVSEDKSNAPNLDDRPGSGDGRKHHACCAAAWKVNNTDKSSLFVSALSEQSAPHGGERSRR